MKCANLSSAEYIELGNCTEPWLCNECTKCNFSDSFFDYSYVPDLNLSSTSTEPTDDIFDNLTSIRKQHPKRFLCACLNINSIRNKFHHVRQLLTENIVDLLFLLETKIDDSFPDAQFNVDNYHMWRADRTDHGGGVMAFLRSDIPGERKQNSRIPRH